MSTYDNVKRILSIEQKHDVTKFKHHNVELWPIVRSSILNQFIRKIKDGEAKSLPKKSKNLKFNINYGIFLLKNIVYYFIKKKSFKKYLKSLELAQSEILFLGNFSHYFDIINERAYDRFRDPFIELIENKHTYQKIIVADSIVQIENPFIPYKFVSNRDVKHYCRCFHNIFSKRKIRNIIKKIKRELEIDFDENYFEQKLIDVIANYKLFKFLLVKTKPKVVFSAVYYSAENFGMTMAAKELGIKVVDIQHGKNGKYNHMVSHLHRFPSKGWNLLPDIFWTWGESFSKDIEHYYPDNFKYNKPIIGGNLWLEKCIHQDCYSLNPEEQEFMTSIQTKEHVVLFSLQPLEQSDVIPSWLAKVISENKNQMWLLRMHPMQTKSKIDWKGCDKLDHVDIVHSTNIPLFYLLKYIDINVTLWSSVGIDALEFGVRTIVAHEEGRKIFEDEIKEGVFGFCEEQTNFNLELNKLLNPKVKINKKMITDKELIKDSLNELLTN